MAGRRLALIVATDEYRDPGLKQLRAPGTDAQALATVLGDPERGEFEVEIVRNETSSTIAERVEATLAGGKPEDLIVLHFSCHGLKDDSGELYLAATNTQPSLLASTALDASFVNRLMRRSRSQRVVLFLDCCYGGAFERGMAPRAAGLVDVSDQFQQRDTDASGGRGRVVITASNAMEFAFEGTDLADMINAQPSVFTGALVQGLTTGEADRDQDGMVSLGELYDYIFDRVRSESPNQTPGKWEFGLQGELFLAKNPQRVIVPAPIPPELLELVDHPFPATRQGSIDVLVRLAETTNLPVAAGARETLERLTADDSRSVAAAASAAVERTGLRLSAAEIDLGSIDIGAAASTASVTIEGPPLTAASKVETSSPALHVRRIDRTIEIEVDTSTPGPIDGIVAVTGPAGHAEVHIVGTVGAVAASAAMPPPVVARPAPVIPPPPIVAEPIVPPQPAFAPPPSREPEPVRAAAPPPTADRSESAALVTATAAPGTPAAPAAPWTIKRVIGRTFIGAILATLIAGAGYWFDVGSSLGLQSYTEKTGAFLVVNAVWFTVIVAALEWFVKAVRVPDGTAYLGARGNALLTAAIQGAVVMTVVGYLDYYSINDSTGLTDGVYWLPVGGALGWVIAEALLSARDAPAPAKPT